MPCFHQGSKNVKSESNYVAPQLWIGMLTLMFNPQVAEIQGQGKGGKGGKGGGRGEGQPRYFGHVATLFVNEAEEVLILSRSGNAMNSATCCQCGCKVNFWSLAQPLQNAGRITCPQLSCLHTTQSDVQSISMLAKVCIFQLFHQYSYLYSVSTLMNDLDEQTILILMYWSCSHRM